MSIVDQQLVDIEIVTNSSGAESVLKLNYHGHTYHLYQAFAVPKLESLAATVRERVKQQWQQLTVVHGDRYLLVREVGYYSLWELEHSSFNDAQAVTASNCSNFDPLLQMQMLGKREVSIELGLQQASIWLFQELWLQLEELIGTRQLQLSADNLVGVTPQVKSWVDLDRLLTLDALKTAKLGAWADDDFARLDRQLYHLAQRKLGQKFGMELTLDIIHTMPERLQLVLKGVLDLR